MDYERIERNYIEEIDIDIYTTVLGDTWDIISLKVYGNEKYAGTLLNANPNHISTYYFSSGVEIICPDIELDISDNLPPWKR